MSGLLVGAVNALNEHRNLIALLLIVVDMAVL